ncbi:uncharacterized protein BDR25DRAFT_387623 [Lindgomyces ingoldianus]|uniref:Uncharacterized protein n=1 Tax=Lindgomyces ingoldianus TaxID=673940 RepID=A0ACB6R2B6_9PLEO|nr:uncharacterized protein BDR25DRAFT_387623 [Lindgomyces ingoldianus]KAF2473398.1 hypothetical protein BDR25DRAFT_387623 [Lindgomyces ingoldianus]
MALARVSLATRRSTSVEDKPDKIAYNIFRLIPVVSTKKTNQNSHMLSTPCFAGTATRLDATSIYRMCQ